MGKSIQPKKWTGRQRGAAVVLAMIMMVVFLSFASLTIDIGHACAVKTYMQNTADAAALAGVAVMINDEILETHYDPVTNSLKDIRLTESISARVNSEASRIATEQTSGTPLKFCDGNIVIGEVTDPFNTKQALDPSGSINAVQVTINRSEKCNGELPTLFAKIFGFKSMDLTVTATAYRDDGYAGFSPPETGNPLLPFSVSTFYYEEQILSGPDDWGWSNAAGGPAPGGDDIPEVWIFPRKAKDDDGITDEGGGNFGTLTINEGSQGTSKLEDQIVNGISDEDLIAEVGTDTLIFLDGAGDAITYKMKGNPGISGGMSDSIELRVGDTIAHFVHDSIVDSGSGATYNIVGIRYGILMEVTLKGSPNKKRLVIQPTVYNGPGLVFDDDAAGNGSLVSRVRLVR